MQCFALCDQFEIGVVCNRYRFLRICDVGIASEGM
jgi:hypothetical protein